MPEEGHASVLGVDPALERETATDALPSGFTLLFYADGLIEPPVRTPTAASPGCASRCRTGQVATVRLRRRTAHPTRQRPA
ncbi:hypothetical protein [Streptomyces hirsutus]|uniref:hypothetical protein n=1 Tax=Streptomyces hirsutus TaxID=35620 RepID=UPI00332F26F5